ncbi:MAG: hypothetical protein IT249_05835 [Chitinophagaceae bacterium]|nr:hypothetical protein [Chitinophagaceae bacterium]
MKKKSIEYENLLMFVGEWQTTGTVLKEGSNPAVEINGTDTYEWLPHNCLLHKAHVRMGSKKVESFEIIYYDKLTEKYIFQSYDEPNSQDKLQGVQNKDEWLLSGSSRRNQIIFSKNGEVMKGIWEKSDNGFNWSIWMKVQLTKIK